MRAATSVIARRPKGDVAIQGSPPPALACWLGVAGPRLSPSGPLDRHGASRLAMTGGFALRDDGGTGASRRAMTAGGALRASR